MLFKQCVRIRKGNARKGIPFISFDEIALEIQKTFRCIAW